MNNHWPTEEQDISFAEQVMQYYAGQTTQNALGLLEVIPNSEEKQFDFRVADWIIVLAKHFIAQYGADQGDFIIRKIVTRCLVQGTVIH